MLQLALCMTAVSSVSATVLLPADFTTVVNDAGTIVHGRVVDVRSLLAGSSRAIESHVTVAVIESLKGAAGSFVTFRVPNGQVGRYRRILVGAPEFAPGDEIVVFLRGRAPAMPALYGLSQGLYRVSRTEGGAATVTPAARTADGTGAERIVRGDPARRPLPIRDFVRQVTAVLERGR
ncbi:MAG: hypothetical protein A3F70_10395 [Acidobacteria bacterium RIFCSPLOWO2_12_FULL_67_14]|nr:MAG: hypothetical protein A3H29_16290 [Acidobacteria bacterium RIFCSPLOWO2_02_FULL_67_21]OFW36287.1 MAG: hypothetical protein A3F70_10395 [Acidobacteria bacterium RIFCSPLOWO2_12_FULL_67_14]